MPCVNAGEPKPQAAAARGVFAALTNFLQRKHHILDSLINIFGVEVVLVAYRCRFTVYSPITNLVIVCYCILFINKISGYLIIDSFIQLLVNT